MKINDRTPVVCPCVEDSKIKVKRTIRASHADRSFPNNFYCPINHAQTDDVGNGRVSCLARFSFTASGACRFVCGRSWRCKKEKRKRNVGD